MERLTKRLEDGQAVMDCAACGVSWHKKRKKDIPYCTALFCRNRLKERLAAYEDTGLEPQDVISAVDMSKIACALHELNAYKDLGSINHLRDLLQAEKSGQLVVLPVNTQETVYVVGEKRIMACFIAEAYIDDARRLEYMVSFDCDDDCDGCPFDSWRQDYSGEYSCDGSYGEGCILGSGFGKTFFLTREEAEAALSKANTIPCKHGLSRHRNEIGEDEVYCELNAKWMNVSLGDCLGNCESEAALVGKGDAHEADSV